MAQRLVKATRPSDTVARLERFVRRGGKLLFSETNTEYRTLSGELVVTARGVGVRTEKVVESK